LKSAIFCLIIKLKSGLLFSLGDAGQTEAGEGESPVGDHLSLDSESGAVDDDTRTVDDVDDDGDLSGHGAEVDVHDSSEAK
jgi:hypothetical protein